MVVREHRQERGEASPGALSDHYCGHQEGDPAGSGHHGLSRPGHGRLHRHRNQQHHPHRPGGAGVEDEPDSRIDGGRGHGGSRGPRSGWSKSFPCPPAGGGPDRESQKRPFQGRGSRQRRPGQSHDRDRLQRQSGRRHRADQRLGRGEERRRHCAGRST